MFIRIKTPIPIAIQGPQPHSLVVDFGLDGYEGVEEDEYEFRAGVFLGADVFLYELDEGELLEAAAFACAAICAFLAAEFSAVV